MKYFWFFGFILIVLLASCQSVDEVEKPKVLLSKSEMKALVYDMVLLDAASGSNEKRLEELDIDMLEFLSKKYKIDSSDLQQNILYYNMMFDDNHEIYEKVKDSIFKLEKVYDSISNVRDSLKRIDKKRNDSIRKLDTTSTDKTILKKK